MEVINLKMKKKGMHKKKDRRVQPLKYHGNEDCPTGFNGQVEKRSKRKKMLLVKDANESSGACQDEGKELSSIDKITNPLEKGKKKRLALRESPKENSTEADAMSIKKKMKRKKKVGVFQSAEKTKGIEIELDAVKIKGSQKRKKRKYEIEAKETLSDVGPDITEGNALMNNFLVPSNKSDRDASDGSVKRKKKKKKPNPLESKRKPDEDKRVAVVDEEKTAQGLKKSRLGHTSVESETSADEAEEISGVDNDHSKGMKKWLHEYWSNKPGLIELQQKIDEFIVAHEMQEEQARKEQEALAAEGGWTVVVRHKGQKKSSDPETGIRVGSVAQAAVLDNMSKKKKDIPLDFYRFQKREAQRNEVMSLQSKFELDKKRIQQLRAARKFRPY